jgi:hypothetical protein
MIRVFFLAIALVINLTINAQQAGVQPEGNEFLAKYAKFDFKGNFAATVDKDEANTYFLVDFSKLPTRFERVYFMNLSFASDELVNIDSDISKSNVCFKASNKYSEKDILKIFDELKSKVVLISSEWTDDKESQWLNKNDKYK